MPRIDLDSSNLADFERRFNAVSSTEQRQWGTMSLAQMLAHMRITFEVSLEERETEDESRAWLLPILWFLMFEVFTNWPHGKIPATTQFLDDSADDVEGERTKLIESMRRFVEQADNT